MTDTPINQLHQENRLSWNEATKAHNSHKGDQAKFFSSGGSTLFPEEKELLSDITGLSLVHLQCNAGQDTLSLARLGAKVTGVDISDEAIEFAQKLSQASGIHATFHRSDIYDWLAKTANTNERFDSDYVAQSAGGLTPWGYEKGIEDFRNPYPSHEFQWGIGEIITAVLEAKLNRYLMFSLISPLTLFIRYLRQLAQRRILLKKLLHK